MLLESGEDLAMVDDIEAIGKPTVLESFQDGRNLRINDNMDFAKPRREAEDRADAPVDLAGIVETRFGRAGRA